MFFSVIFAIHTLFFTSSATLSATSFAISSATSSATSFFTSSCIASNISSNISHYISSCASSYLSSDILHVSQLSHISRVSHAAIFYMIMNNLFRMFNTKKQFSQTRIITYFKSITLIIEMSKRNARKLNASVIKLFAFSHETHDDICNIFSVCFHHCDEEALEEKIYNRR